MKFDHAPEIDRADHIDIVHKERLSAPRRILKKKIRGFLQPAAGVEQHLLARHLNPHAEVIIRLQTLDNHVRKVMYVDDHLANTKGSQARESYFQERAAGNLH